MRGPRSTFGLAEGPFDWSAGQATALAQAATGARLTCLGSFNPSAATSGKGNAAIQAALQGSVKPQEASKKESESPSIKERPAAEKSQKAKAAVGVVHDGIVDFADEAPGKKRNKQQRKSATLKGKATNMQSLKGTSVYNSDRGRQRTKSVGIKGTPMKRKQRV